MGSNFITLFEVQTDVHIIFAQRSIHKCRIIIWPGALFKGLLGACKCYKSMAIGSDVAKRTVLHTASGNRCLVNRCSSTRVHFGAKTTVTVCVLSCDSVDGLHYRSNHTGAKSAVRHWANLPTICTFPRIVPNDGGAESTTGEESRTAEVNPPPGLGWSRPGPKGGVDECDEDFAPAR